MNKSVYNRDIQISSIWRKMISGNTISYYIGKYSLKKILNPRLIKNMKMFRFESYKTIFPAQEEIPMIFLLVGGRLRCAHYNSNGTLAVVAVSEPLTAIGDVEILNNKPASTAVITTAPSVLLGIPMDIIRKHGLDDPVFLRFIIEQLVDKLNFSTSLRLGHILPVKSRLALYIMTRPESDSSNVVILPEKEVLASMLGTTLRHLNRVLKELIYEGAIGSGYPGIGIKDKKILSSLIG